MTPAVTMVQIVPEKSKKPKRRKWYKFNKKKTTAPSKQAR